MTNTSEQTVKDSLSLLGRGQTCDFEYLSGIEKPSVVVVIRPDTSQDERMGLLVTAKALCDKIRPDARIVCVADGVKQEDTKGLIDTLSLQELTTVISAETIRMLDSYKVEKKCADNLSNFIEPRLGKDTYLPHADHIAQMRSLRSEYNAAVVLDAGEKDEHRGTALARSGGGAPQTLYVDTNNHTNLARALRSAFKYGQDDRGPEDTAQISTTGNVTLGALQTLSA